MFEIRRIVGRKSFWPGLAAVGFVASVALQAQATVPGDHSAYFGGWTLNREMSSTPPTPAGPNGRGRESDAGRGRGGGRSGRRGGGGGFGAPGGARESGGPPSFDPKEMEMATALIQELMTPTAHWILRSADDGTIIFSDAEGRSARFVPNDKKEKHQLTAGTVETRTKWDKERLRQEISLPAGRKAVRVFAVTPEETKQLTVTITTEGGPDGRRPPFRFVYDRDGGPALGVAHEAGGGRSQRRIVSAVSGQTREAYLLAIDDWLLAPLKHVGIPQHRPE